MSAALVSIGATSAGAGLLPPPPGCGFRLGPITNTGAAGTHFYTAVLEPISPLQRCTAVVTFTVTATLDPRSASQGPYRHIDHNPLTATEVVAFMPGGFSPELGLAWAGFGCADPALPGTLRFVVGSRSTSTPINPQTCDGSTPSSSFAAFTPRGLPSVARVIGIAPTRDDRGYVLLDEVGNATVRGAATALPLRFSAAAPLVAIRTAPTGDGSWIVDSRGYVTAFGSAELHGDLRSVSLNAPIVGMAATPSGHGSWLVAADGGVFAFGDAAFRGSLGSLLLNAPIVGMAATPSGHGYWLVAADGGVFAFGDAAFRGSLGNLALNAPIVGVAAGPHGGYLLVAADGGVFAFGVPFEGSAGALRPGAPVCGIAATTSGKGYWLVAADGGVFSYGDARFFGSSLRPVG